MLTENLSTLKIHKLTQSQYDRELAAGRIDENAIYLTPDEDSQTIIGSCTTIEALNANHGDAPIGSIYVSVEG